MDKYREYFERENLRVARSFALNTLKRYREGWLPAETAAINLLDMRQRFVLPFMLEHKKNPEHPYTIFSARLVRIATILVGEEWVENYIENLKKTRLSRG